MILPDPGSLALRAAEEIALRCAEAVSARGRFTLAVSGGSTPRGLYALLADPSGPYRRGLPWTHVEFFFCDERHVIPEDPESNYGMVETTLFSHLPIRPEQVHRFRTEGPDTEEIARSYEAELRATLPPEPDGRHRLDLALLGLGADGHTASLLPGDPLLEERRSLVGVASGEYRGTRRITLTYPMLNAARAAVFLVSGREKAATVAAILTGTGGSLPAAGVRPADGELVWLLDTAAAQELTRGPPTRVRWRPS